jgi:hypothetical protein
MTPAERKRYDAKIAARHKAQDIAAKKKKHLAKVKKDKDKKDEKEGRAYGSSRIKIQRAIREKQREGLDYKERTALREKLAQRRSYGRSESGTPKSFSDVYLGVGAEPPMTYSKGDKPVKKVAPTKKKVIKKEVKKPTKSKIPKKKK